MTSTTIPGSEIKVRLRNVASDRSLFANKDKFGALNGGVFPDQWWRLQPGEGKLKGYYRLVNADNSLIVFHAKSRKVFGTFDQKAAHDDQYWMFVPGDGLDRDCFRIKNFESEHCIFASSDDRFGAFQGAEYEDQLWQFVFEDGSIAGVLPRPTATAPELIAGFPSWTIKFNDAGEFEQPDDRYRAAGLLDYLANCGGPHHVFVMVHGVGTDVGEYEGYIGVMGGVFDDTAPGMERSKVAMVRIGWKSQDMGDMLTSLINLKDVVGKRVKMPAQILAEKGLSTLLNRMCAVKGRDDRHVHLVGHSMGTQALLYVLPAVQRHVRLGSMFMIQGFAPTSAFLETPENRGWVRKLIDDYTPFNLPEFIKVTDFFKHTGKVNGPICATVTTRGQDIQIFGGAKTVYADSGALGMDGFTRNSQISDRVTGHYIVEDTVSGGTSRYGFESGKKFVTIDFTSHIREHSRFKNKAVAFANLRAAKVISADHKAPGAGTVAAAPMPGRPWMRDAWTVLGARRLNQVCLPGSHDSGTGVIRSISPSSGAVEALIKGAIKSYDQAPELISTTVSKLLQSTAGVAEGILGPLTRTHSVTLAEQMARGCRYFDLRPAVDAAGNFSLSHVTKMAGMWVGGIGEPLADALQAFRSFADKPENDHELMILHFSHPACLATGKDMSPAQVAKVVAMVEEALGAKMITAQTLGENAPRLATLTLDRLRSGGRTLLCLFAKFDSALDPGKGIFKGDKEVGHLPIYDEYSNSQSVAEVIEGQLQEFRKAMDQRGTGSDSLFLLSWTATLDPVAALLDGTSILQRAQLLNGHLDANLRRWIEQGVIKRGRRPNILYVDDFNETILASVALINGLAL